MTTQIKYFLIITLSISWVFVACDDTDDSTITAGMEVAAGQVAAGQVTAGQVVAGEVAAGQVMAGEVAAGQVMAGETMAGETMAGEVMAGEVMTGGMSDIIVGDGACTNPNDLARFEALGETGLGEAIEGCLGDCFVPGSESCGTCLEGATGFSTECSACFQTITECTVLNCVAQCAVGPESDGCTQCRADNCNAAFVECAGVEPQ